MDVAKVGGQLWQKPLYVSSIAIPRDQTMNGSGVTQIMKPWLIASAIVALHAGVETYPAERPFGALPGHRFSQAGNKEGCGQFGRVLPKPVVLKIMAVAEVRFSKVATKHLYRRQDRRFGRLLLLKSP